MKLTTRGKPLGIRARIVARVSREPVLEATLRPETVFVPADTLPLSEWNTIEGYRAILSHAEAHEVAAALTPSVVPMVHSADVDHLRTGDIVTLAADGFVRTVYRPDSSSNTLFATDRCNSNCLMCSQPPKDADDSYRIEENIEIIRLIKPQPEYLGITGGEPTLLGEGLFRQLEALRGHLPGTHVHILTNGRRFAWPDFTQRFAEIGHSLVSLGIPLYADNAADHDYVVQACGAFDQTMIGLHRLAEHRQNVEIRVVLHALTIGRLRALVEFIYRNIPFANHVALMGLEITGYTPHNMACLWVDPYEYQSELLSATAFLANRGMNVSIYNHQLCVLEPQLWPFARRSISDWKNIYVEECELCLLRSKCGGLFKSSQERHSAHIRPFLDASYLSP